MKDVLVVIDVLNDFEHEDGERVVGSFRERVPALREAIDSARASGVPVMYVNDHHGDWSADRGEMVARATRTIHARELGVKVTILTAACVTVDQEREDVALRYARDVAGILLEDRVDAILEPVGAR